MSAAFEDGAMVSAGELNAVPTAEFTAGVVGGDGTEPDDEKDAAWKEAEAERIARSMECSIEVASANATTVMKAAASEVSSDAMWGISTLAELASTAAWEAFERDAKVVDMDRLRDASDLYAQAIAVTEMADAAIHVEMVQAGIMLLEIAKQRIDALTDSTNRVAA